MIKKTISLLILIIGVFGIFGCGKQVKKVVAMIDNPVGYLTIYSQTQSPKDTMPMLLNLGHSFLSFENTSNNDIIIGNYNVSPNETICIGTWSISSHFGVWFNVESNYNNKYNRYDGRISITRQISESNIDDINGFIAKHNYWNPLRNCSYFALNLWNSVANQSEKLAKPLIYSPTHVANEIKKFNNFEYNRPMVTTGNMGYYSNSQFVSVSMKGEDKYV